MNTSTATLNRTTFRTSRLLDFCSRKEMIDKRQRARQRRRRRGSVAAVFAS